MDVMFQPYRKYADFEGRARRLEYWLFHLMFAIVYCVVAAAMVVAHQSQQPALEVVAGLALVVFALGSVIPSIALNFRRLHDIDKSAWWILIGLIPVLGVVVLLIFHLMDGTPGPNKYGPDPKGRGAAPTQEALAGVG
jgi:uncharacterized membrane protein YhaH (DUF805 family)